MPYVNNSALSILFYIVYSSIPLWYFQLLFLFQLTRNIPLNIPVNLATDIRF